MSRFGILLKPTAPVDFQYDRTPPRTSDQNHCVPYIALLKSDLQVAVDLTSSTVMTY